VAKAIVLIRIVVGWVFLSEGIRKFLFPDTLGAGRFAKIGIPWPQTMAPFVGTVEILCGTLTLLGPLHSVRCDSTSITPLLLTYKP
jgi:putative oxidoreductase